MQLLMTLAIFTGYVAGPFIVLYTLYKKAKEKGYI